MKNIHPILPRGADTREALVQAALQEFAVRGFHAVTTRDIAASAGANQALINYHFRGKDGLYIAVFEHISRQIQDRIGPVVQKLEDVLGAPGRGSAARRRDELLELLLGLLDAMAALFADEETAPWAQLILREQQAPTKAFDLLYEGFMGRIAELVTELVRRIRPRTTDEKDLRLLVVTLIGQVLVFRAARAVSLRHIGWERIGPDELEAIRKRIRGNVKAILMAKD